MIPIVFSTDHNYVMPTCVTIASLLQSGKENYAIYVLVADDVNEDDRSLLRNQVAELSAGSVIDFLSMGGAFDGGFEIRGISKACYFRLLIPWLLPDVEKVIYSDVDIIFRTGLRELYSTELGEDYFAGVVARGSVKTMKKHISRLGLDPEAYINSGLILINAAKMREDNMKETFLKLAEKKLLFQDQDIINIASKGRIRFLPERWNMSPAWLAEDVKAGKCDGTTRGCVLHYSGLKPWEAMTYCWNEWWDTYKATKVYDPTFSYKVESRILSYTLTARRFMRSLSYKIKNALG